MTPSSAADGWAVLAPPLDPSGDQGRALLRRELLHSEYHGNLLQRLLDWLQGLVGQGADAASRLTPLSTLAALVVLLLLLAGLGAVLSRARRSARVRRRRDRGPLAQDRLDAAALRARAEAALAEGRHEDALLDGFRALAVRQVERGRLEDDPGTTAHEVAAALAAAYPGARAGVEEGARLFEQVRYGDRPATAEQAAGVLSLDDELAGRRPAGQRVGP